MRVWDTVSGQEVRQASGFTFALVEGAAQRELRTNRHLITAGGLTVMITSLRTGCASSVDLRKAEDGKGPEAAPVAFFKVPRPTPEP